MLGLGIVTEVKLGLSAEVNISVREDTAVEVLPELEDVVVMISLVALSLVLGQTRISGIVDCNFLVATVVDV